MKNLLRKSLLWILAALSSSALAIVALVWYGEYRREALIRLYEVPSFYLNMLSAIEGKRAMADLMSDDEIIVCFLQQRTFGNLILDNIMDELSVGQRKAARDLTLPSPDSDGRYWYILFFRDETISRVYLAANNDLDVDLISNASSCVNRSRRFVVVENNSQEIGKKLLIKFTKE